MQRDTLTENNIRSVLLATCYYLISLIKQKVIEAAECKMCDLPRLVTELHGAILLCNKLQDVSDIGMVLQLMKEQIQEAIKKNRLDSDACLVLKSLRYILKSNLCDPAIDLFRATCYSLNFCYDLPQLLHAEITNFLKSAVPATADLLYDFASLLFVLIGVDAMCASPLTATWKFLLEMETALSKDNTAAVLNSTHPCILELISYVHKVASNGVTTTTTFGKRKRNDDWEVDFHKD